jgi:TetR/AcrR family transcriptional regulator, regulator of autoinduction and epiphytic fitness
LSGILNDIHMTNLTTSSTTTAEPPADDPRVERTRAAVIKAAADLLMHGGTDKVTHANVATGANVSRTTVYKHWPTRADLLRSTIEELGKTFPNRDEFTGDLRHDLGLLLANLVKDLLDEAHCQLIVMMMERSQYDNTVAAVRDDMVCEGEVLFDEVLTAAVRSGQLRADLDPKQAMASLAGSLLFMRFMTAASIDDRTLPRLIDEFVTSNAPRS